MFHQYVLNAESVPIDIDRATFLMDKRLWWAVCAEMAERGEKDPQCFWDEYCERHWEKYGSYFSPHTMKEPL